MEGNPRGPNQDIFGKSNKIKRTPPGLQKESIRSEPTGSEEEKEGAKKISTQRELELVAERRLRELEQEEEEIRAKRIEAEKTLLAVSPSGSGILSQTETPRRVSPKAWGIQETCVAMGSAAAAVSMAGFPGLPQRDSEQLRKKFGFGTAPSGPATVGGTDSEIMETESESDGRSSNIRKRRRGTNSPGYPEDGDPIKRLEDNLRSMEKWLANASKGKSLTVDSREKLRGYILEAKENVWETLKEISFLKGKNEGREEILKEIKEEIMEARRVGPIKSYAGAAAARSTTEEMGYPKGRGKPRETSVVLVYPETDEGENAKLTSEDTRRKLAEIINPKEQFIQVKNIRKVRRGGIAVETANREGARKILENVAVRESGLRPREPSRTRPKILVYDLPDSKKEEEDDVIEGIREQNPDLEEPNTPFKNDIKVIRKIKSNRQGRAHWVLECSPRLRSLLLERERIYYEWESNRIKEYDDVTRCYKCQMYGHVAKFCKEKDPACGHCAGPHETRECPKKDEQAVCTVCKKFNKEYRSHGVTAKECPAYQRAVAMRQRSTDYGH